MPPPSDRLPLLPFRRTFPGPPEETSHDDAQDFRRSLAAFRRSMAQDRNRPRRARSAETAGPAEGRPPPPARRNALPVADRPDLALAAPGLRRRQHRAPHLPPLGRKRHFRQDPRTGDPGAS